MAPRAASACAMAKPSPREAPVTIATRPAREKGSSIVKISGRSITALPYFRIGARTSRALRRRYRRDEAASRNLREGRKESAVAGLYDGVEEVRFTSVAGGFVFQTNNPWFFGPRRRYFVNEAQKSAISACIRETLRRLIPLVIAAAILIPIVLISGTFWLALQGATLDVAVTSATGETTSYNRPITAEGATVTLAAQAGAKMVYRVTGFPGKDAVMTYSWVDAKGKAGAPSSTPFGPAGMKVAIVDDNQRTINSAVLVGRRGATPNAILLDAALLGLATFAPYFAAIHLYGLRRLRPLLVDLP